MNLLKVGVIHTPFEKLDDCPNNVSSTGPECTLEIDSPYQEALIGLKQGQKILVLYWLDKADRKPVVQVNIHKKNKEQLGTFALRSPNRPNPIGASEVIIESINENIILVKGLDCLNGTAIIDIKPA